MITLFAYSRKGIETARRIGGLLSGELRFYTAERLAGDGFLPIPKPSAPLYGEAFAASEALVFVSSCGIAVRSVAPYLKSKTTDPAVVAVDETGRFAVSLLSGHLGGANALAERIAEGIGATPVVTTATDSNGRFSVDSWAKAQGLVISDMGMAKRVSAAILESDVPVKSELPISGELPAGLRTGGGEIGVCITYKTEEPFARTLRLIPKCVHIGIGCRRGTTCEAIENAVKTALFENGVDPRAVKSAASIDIKKDEAGLLEYCRKNELPVSFHSADELNAVKGEFTPSEFVKSVTGVDSVCERAALLGADELIIKKTARDGVTVAAALEKTEVRFG